jgi:hypothetical protein
MLKNSLRAALCLAGLVASDRFVGAQPPAPTQDLAHP